MVNRRGQQYLTDNPVPGPRIIFDAILIILLVAILIKVYFVPTVLEVPARPTTTLQQQNTPIQAAPVNTAQIPTAAPIAGAVAFPEGAYPPAAASGPQLGAPPAAPSTQQPPQAPTEIPQPISYSDIDPLAAKPVNMSGPQ